MDYYYYLLKPESSFTPPPPHKAITWKERQATSTFAKVMIEKENLQVSHYQLKSLRNLTHIY